ncbi:MAG: helix-turn-helix domain-containing protein [Dehalococcoidia bacterium]
MLLTVDEAAEVLRIGRNGAYAAVANGCLLSVRIGRTIRIPRDALAALIGADARAPEERQRTAGG